MTGPRHRTDSGSVGTDSSVYMYSYKKTKGDEKKYNKITYHTNARRKEQDKSRKYQEINNKTLRFIEKLNRL